MAGTRNALIFGVLTTALLVATSCSSSGGNTHDSTPPTTDSTSSSTANSSSTSPSPTPSWTPPDYGTAKPAVDAYLEFQALHSKALEDPAHTSASTFDKYLGGQLKQQIDTAFAAEKRQGRAYRGKAIRRVRVVQNHMNASLKWAVLRDCAAVDPGNPLVEYYVATGKPVPQKPHNPPGPYADTIKIFLINGQWTITSFTVDSTRTCKP
jgi:hypothetical protein